MPQTIEEKGLLDWLTGDNYADIGHEFDAALRDLRRLREEFFDSILERKVDEGIKRFSVVYR